MSEVYEMAPDGETGEDVLVQKITCSKCGHFEYFIPSEVEKLTDDSFECKLCSNPDKVFRGIKEFVQCGVCSQVFSSDKPECFCPDKTKPMLTFYNKSKKSPVTKRLEDSIEEEKMQSMERKLVRSAKEQEFERKKRTDENLEKLVGLLMDKEKK